MSILLEPFLTVEFLNKQILTKLPHNSATKHSEHWLVATTHVREVGYLRLIEGEGG